MIESNIFTQHEIVVATAYARGVVNTCSEVDVASYDSWHSLGIYGLNVDIHINLDDDNIFEAWMYREEPDPSDSSYSVTDTSKELQLQL